MCKSPIRIKNNAKYIATGVGHPLYLWVNCGKCDECIKAKTKEWNYRTIEECKETIRRGGYMYFDTLTYSNKNLPRITNFITANKNFACFNYKHIRTFYESLRQQLKLNEDKDLRYFITSEYGDIRKRPHYHVLLFVPNYIEKERISKEVSKAWKYGRTDGQPYKSLAYVRQHNIIEEVNLNCIKYVAKYVNKSQTFQTIINKRWNDLLKFYEKSRFNKLQIKRFERQYKRLTTPFHRQSKGFGESIMQKLNIDYIMDNPMVFYKDNEVSSITKKLQLPMYYKRKIFQKQVVFNNKRLWINTEKGIEFKKRQEDKLLESVKDKIQDQATNNQIDLTEEVLQELAKYILFERGRLTGQIDYKPHHKQAKYFNYNTDKDLLNLGKKCISKEFAGNDTSGYCTTNIEPIDLENEIRIRADLEAILATLGQNRDNSSLVLLKEHINEIRKIFFR